MDGLIIKEKIKKIISDYIIEIEAIYDKYDPYNRGCRYSVYDRKSKIFMFGGDCSSISSPEDLMDRMTIIIMNRNKEG